MKRKKLEMVKKSSGTETKRNLKKNKVEKRKLSKKTYDQIMTQIPMIPNPKLKTIYFYSFDNI